MYFHVFDVAENSGALGFQGLACSHHPMVDAECPLRSSTRSSRLFNLCVQAPTLHRRSATSRTELHGR